MGDPPSSSIPPGHVAEMSVWIEWLEEPLGTSQGQAYARRRTNQAPLHWCYCPVCRSVDLYDTEYIAGSVRGRICGYCNGNNVGISTSGAYMRRLPDQVAACAAFLLGGLDAVSAIAKQL